MQVRVQTLLHPIGPLRPLLVAASTLEMSESAWPQRWRFSRLLLELANRQILGSVATVSSPNADDSVRGDAALGRLW